MSNKLLKKISNLAFLCLFFTFGFPLAGKEVPDSSTAEWKNLKSSLFGKKEVISSNNIIGIEAPFRAEDAAVFPFR